MKKTYFAPELDIHSFNVKDIITTSGETLTDGGENGTPEDVQFETLFPEK